MAQQRTKLPLPLSFNVNFSDSSSLEESSNKVRDIPKLPVIPKPKHQLAQLFIKQPASKKHARESIIAKCITKRKVMPFSSTPKISAADSESSEIDFSPITNMTQYSIDQMQSRSYDDLAPKSSNHMKKPTNVMVRMNSVERDFVDHVTNTVDLKNNAKQSKGQQPHDEQSVSSTTSPEHCESSLKAPNNKLLDQDIFVKPQPIKSSQNTKEHVTVRKTIAKADTENILQSLNIRDYHENSACLTFGNLETIPTNPKKGVKPSLHNSMESNRIKPLLSLNTNEDLHPLLSDGSCNLPFNSKHAQLNTTKAALDKVLGLSASIISVSSGCASTYEDEPSQVIKEVSRKNISVNTTKVHATPKTREKPKVNKRKTSIRNISTNTTPLQDDSESDSNQLVQKHSIKKKNLKVSVGTNTSYKKRISKTHKPSRNIPQKDRSVIHNDDASNRSTRKTVSKSKRRSTILPNIKRESLRTRTKQIDYSYRNSTSQTNSKHTSDDTALPQTRNNRTAKQTKKRKINCIPATLQAHNKTKTNKELLSNLLPNERLSGYYEMDVQQLDHSKESTRTRRRGRPPSLFIQSHIVGSGPLKNVLLKKLSKRSTIHNKNPPLDITENTNQTHRGRSTARKSVKEIGLRKSKSTKKTESTISSDDTAFKKPLPVKRLRTSASTSTSSASTVGYDREVLISSPGIETIDELPYDESTEMHTYGKDISSTSLQRVKDMSSKNKRLSSDASPEHSPIKKRKKSSNTNQKETSVTNAQNETAFKNRSGQRITSQGKYPENGKSSSKDSGVVTACTSNPDADSTTANVSRQSPRVRKSLLFNKSQSDSSTTKLAVNIENNPTRLNDAIYEIENSSIRFNSLEEHTPKSKKSIENENENTILSSSKPDNRVNKSVPSSISVNTRSSTSTKPRKSVTFCEPIILENDVVEKESSLRKTKSNNRSNDDDVMNPKTALALSARKNSRQPALVDTTDDDSDSETNNRGALCTVVDNKAVLLRKWISETPDFALGAENAVVKYTLKNIPIVGATLGSGCLVIGPGEKKDPHAAMKQCLLFYVLSGQAIIKVQGVKSSANAGSHFIIPLGCIYSIRNTDFEKPLTLFFVKIAPH